MTWLLIAAVFWAGAFWLNLWLTRTEHPSAKALIPALFGVSLLLWWEALARGLPIPAVILPAPSAIGARIAESLPLLWGDFTQTILKGALTGYAIGALSAVATAIAIDRSPFLQRGLLPIGNFLAALPIVGIAPILVMWFGFDWQSKAAVVVVMVFFPILVNMVAGLCATDQLSRDLMRSYCASDTQALLKLRLPAALPFLFNGLKIATTLALIGAIVAEFFGSPTRGMGFRISTAVGQLDMPLVWAEITLAALAGTGFFGLMTLLERRLTSWHPSQR